MQDDPIARAEQKLLVRLEQLRKYRERWEGVAVPFGYCQCGCGYKTPLARRSATAYGHIIGFPTFYRVGHQRRKGHGWLAEDRGYETSCWIWQAGVGGHGYGTLSYEGRTVLAHRVAYQQHVGSIPAGYHLDHLCRVRACVNPAHLEAVAPAINARRGINTKLTQEDVDDIRRSSLPQAEIAAKYGVHSAHISRIRSLRAWRPVEHS